MSEYTLVTVNDNGHASSEEENGKIWLRSF